MVQKVTTFFRFLLNPRLTYAPAAADTAEASQELPAGRAARPTALLNPALMLGLVVLLGAIIAVLFGPLLADYDPNLTLLSVVPHYVADTGEFVKPPFSPSVEHPLGTDEWGNDLLDKILHGARITLVVGLYITLARVIVGTVLGSLAGWRANGLPDRIVRAASGAIAAVPALLSSLILVNALNIERGASVFVIALTLLGWTEIAEYVRGELLVIRKMPYIEGAEAVGATEAQMIVRHVLPNLLPQLLIIGFLEMGAVLVLVAELGFLGIYVGGASTFTMDPVFGRPTQLAEWPEWGALVARGVPFVRSWPHIVLAPAAAFFVAILGANALGEGLRRLLHHFPISTAFLLRRWALIVIGLFIAAATVVVQLTGPTMSYRSVARDYSGRAASRHVLALAGSESEVLGQGPAEYIRAGFSEYGLERGAKPTGGLLTSYFTTPTPEEEPYPTLVGFLSGYDAEYADDLVIIASSYRPREGQENNPASRFAGVGAMLELARLWQEHRVDPRRSVLFVAWGGGSLAGPEFQAFLDEPNNFDHLPIPSQDVARPWRVVVLDQIEDGNYQITGAVAGDPAMAERLAQAMRIDGEASIVGEASDAYSLPTPMMLLRWADYYGGGAPATLDSVGEILNRSLLPVLRQAEY